MRKASPAVFSNVEISQKNVIFTIVEYMFFIQVCRYSNELDHESGGKVQNLLK